RAAGEVRAAAGTAGAPGRLAAAHERQRHAAAQPTLALRRGDAAGARRDARRPGRSRRLVARHLAENRPVGAASAKEGGQVQGRGSGSVFARSPTWTRPAPCETEPDPFLLHASPCPPASSPCSTTSRPCSTTSR